MLVLLDDAGKIASYADVPDIALDLIEVADKPTTIIYPGAKRLAPNLIAEDGTIGIRITREEFTRSLIFRYNKPIVSTSANISGEPSPHFFGEISEGNTGNLSLKQRKNRTEWKKYSSTLSVLERQ